MLIIKHLFYKHIYEKNVKKQLKKYGNRNGNFSCFLRNQNHQNSLCRKTLKNSNKFCTRSKIKSANVTLVY